MANESNAVISVAVKLCDIREQLSDENLLRGHFVLHGFSAEILREYGLVVKRDDEGDWLVFDDGNRAIAAFDHCTLSWTFVIPRPIVLRYREWMLSQLNALEKDEMDEVPIGFRGVLDFLRSIQVT